MTDILIDCISFSRETKTILSDITLEITSGESLAIVGQNGAGKTTLVKLLTGLIRPDKGRILLEQQDSSKKTVAQLAHQIAYVYQNPMDQIFHQKIYDEVIFGAKQLKKDSQTMERLVEEALDITGLSDLRQENPYDLPFSMMKFVTIASVLCMDTDVVIFDEPTAGQDYQGKVRLGQIIQYLRDKGKTIIVITHDMEFVVDHFDRCLSMADGEIVSDSDKRELFWNLAVLEKTKLKQPFIADLAHERLKGTSILTAEEFTQTLLESRK